MENNKDEGNSFNPSFFQNSCPGKESVQETEIDVITATAMFPMLDGEDRPRKKKTTGGGNGGYTCCVPGCYNNSKKHRNLSFYSFPDGERKEKQLLRKRWIQLISRKGFVPTIGHRVCSEHFEGGKKTYLNNAPTITPKTAKQAPVQPRRTERARNRQVFVLQDIKTNSVEFDKEFDENVPPEADNASESLAAVNQLEEQVSSTEELKKQIAFLLEENNTLRSQRDELVHEKASWGQTCKEMSLETIKDDDKLFRFYTGLPDYITFQAIFRFLGPAVDSLIYHDSGTNAGKLVDPEYKKRGPKRSLTPKQEFFLVLVRLRLGLLEEDLACRFQLSQSHISRICITWFDFLHSRFRMLPIWPSRSCVNENMPTCFRETYPTTRVIIDCTELFIEMPSSVRSQSVTYSNYKHHNTAKGLIGITPNGAVAFVSDLCPGRCSDKQITVECGILNLLQHGDTVMADKGFDISGNLPQGVGLNIPPFLRGKDFLNVEEEKETRRIASVRIHVERAIARIKTFRILSSIFPLSMVAELNKVWVICAYLTNFMPPLIAESDS